jgi:hypothetical protein
VVNIRTMVATLGQLRSSLATAAGLTFVGARDIYAALGYKKRLEPADYRERYERHEMAARIVDIFPDETWRGGAELIEDEKTEEMTPFEKAWAELALRVQPWNAFKKADQLAQLGRYSVVLIGAPGDLEQPLGKLKGPQDILFLRPMGEDDAKIQEADLDKSTNSPRYGLPNYYRLRNVGTAGEQKTHWTRIIPVADGLLDDRIYGTPRLKRVWNRLDDLEKLAGGGSEAFWMRAHQGYVANVDPTVQMDEPKIQALRDQIEDFANGLRRTIGQQGVEFKALGSDTADFSNNVDAIVGLIAAGTGIPKRILMGSERGELASSQDAKAWDDRISDRRTQYGDPVVVRPFVDRLIEFNALPKPVKYETRWPEIQNFTEDEQLAMALKAASVNKQMGRVVILPDEIRSRYLGLPPLDEVEIPEDLDPAKIQEREDAKAAADAAAKADAQGDEPIVNAARSAIETRLEAQVLKALRSAQDHVDYPALRAAVGAQDQREVTRLINEALAKIGETLEDGVEEALFQALVRSAKELEQ